ncbi:MAG: hypothetical protein ACE5FP_04260 [Gemmatimonadota bacterium]
MIRKNILGGLVATLLAMAGCGDDASVGDSTAAQLYWQQPDSTFVPTLTPTDAKSMSRNSMWAADPRAKAVFRFTPGEGRYVAIGADDREPTQIQVPAKLAVSPELGLSVYDAETKSVDLFTPDGEFVRGFAVEFTPAVMEFSTAPLGYTFAVASSDFDAAPRVLIIRTDVLGVTRDTLLSPDVGPPALRAAEAAPGQTLMASSGNGLWVWSKAAPDTIFEVAPRSSRVIPVRTEDQAAIGMLSDPATDMLWLGHIEDLGGSYSAYDTRTGVDEAFLGVRTTTGQFSPRLVHDGILMGWYLGEQDRPAAVAYDLNADGFERQDLGEE